MKQIVRRIPTANTNEYCAFIGMENTTIDEGFRARIFDSMEMLVFEGYTHFICDTSCEAGAAAVEMAQMLRSSYPEMTLEIVLPYDIRTVGCSVRMLDLFYSADVVTMVSDLRDMEAGRKLKRYLVQQGNLLLAECNGQTGEAAPIVDWARRAGRSVTCVPNISMRMAKVG